MPEDSNAIQIQTRSERKCTIGIQSPDLIYDRRDICGEYFGHFLLEGLVTTSFNTDPRPKLIRKRDNLAIGENYGRCVKGVLDAHDDIALAGQLLHLGCECNRSAPTTRRENENRKQCRVRERSIVP